MIKLPPSAIVGTLSALDSLPGLLARPGELADCDLVEMRVGPGMEERGLLELLQRLRQVRPLMITIRTCHEGGSWDITDPDRAALFRRLHAVSDLVDLEIASTLCRSASRSELFASHSLCVLSYHDYERCPPAAELLDRLQQAKDWGADIGKLAIMCHSDADVQTLREVLRQSPLPAAILGMGQHGLATRWTFPGLGSRLVYGWLDQAAAPGQPSCRELARHLRPN